MLISDSDQHDTEEVSLWSRRPSSEIDLVSSRLSPRHLPCLALHHSYITHYTTHIHISFSMENSLIPQGIEIVQRAIAADNENEYEKALALYRDALARFTMGLKYEKNEARKKLIIDRVEGYMNRAEELSDYLKKQSELDKGGGGGVAAKSKDDKDEGGEDADKKKLRGALAGAIVTEKPNVSWDDVAGLENAKESLKEVRI
jgi:vacuolar protein-sorting-associated protein 4